MLVTVDSLPLLWLTWLLDLRTGLAMGAGLPGEEVVLVTEEAERLTPLDSLLTFSRNSLLKSLPRLLLLLLPSTSTKVS